jgi:S1-C subfamily serine protease
MPACDSLGRSHNGAHIGPDIDPSQIGIYIGQRVSVMSEPPRARGIQTVHPSTKVLCDADVSFVVLDRVLEGVTILPMRLDGAVESGDWVIPVGFGGGLANEIGTRAPRTTSPVLSVGPGANSVTGAVLGPHEFEVDTATCRGDSGGPAIDVRTGEIVGVVSRGGSCVASGNHVYTRIDSYSGLAQLAFAIAHTDAPQLAMRR